MTAIEKLIKVAEAEVGYLEKRNNAQLDSKTENAGSNNYTKYWQDIKKAYQGQPWCAAFVTWCFAQAFGPDKAAMLLKHYPYVYCPTLGTLFTKNANPKVGDIVIFYRNGEFCHTGIVVLVRGDYFETIEGNTSGGSAIVANGGGVFRKSYYNSKLPGTKFCTPDYSIVETEDDRVSKEEFERLVNSVNEIGAKVTKLEKNAAAQGAGTDMVYNYIDDNMPEWARQPVQWCVDKGIIVGTGEGLGLTDLKLWVCVVVYRTAKVIAKLIKVNI